jgi:hypothetical protein
VFFTVFASPFITTLENSNVFLILFRMAYPKIRRMNNLPTIEEKRNLLIGLKINIKIRMIENTVQIHVVLQESI